MRSTKRTAKVLPDEVRSADENAEWCLGSYSVKSTAKVARMLSECRADEMSESGSRKGSPLTVHQ